MARDFFLRRRLAPALPPSGFAPNQSIPNPISRLPLPVSQMPGPVLLVCGGAASIWWQQWCRSLPNSTVSKYVGYPSPGGFVNFINQPQFLVAHPGENFHLVRLTQAFNPFSPTPQTPCGKGTPPAAAPPPPPVERVVNIDNDEDDVETSRTAKKRHWTLDEEERLASAWLNTSKDLIYGNDKSRENTFWGQISDLFNKNILKGTLTN
ncbi:unnamed protein product [Miscanthus lutarioriparius]|uniref:Uncharacterized protein n=1 Tax=Miscanthus lutarioriparius TaxID=422564 RepID=A0A811N2I6_9POAL|nr:unnamed protein product [Miscanthus lutarioriparius]